MVNSFIEVNTTNILHNLYLIKQHIKCNSQTSIAPRLCLPIKANAYGHGLAYIAKLVQEHVDYLAVSSLAEAIITRNSAPNTPILAFGSLHQEHIASLIEHNIEITIASLLKAKLLVDYCQKYNKIAKVHIKVDTGMNRIGVRVDTFYRLFNYLISQVSFITVVGVYSHLVSSEKHNDLFTLEQVNTFQQINTYIKTSHPQIICHLANSGGVCNYPSSYFDMVRPGLICYGYLPDSEASQAYSLTSYLRQLKPAFSLKTRVAYFKVVASTQGISYNHSYRTQNQTRIVTVPIGYGDGYRRCLSNIGQVIINNHIYTISGNICMDMFMIDIGNNEVYIDDEVVLIGNQGDYSITIEDIAKLYRSISYEVLTGFNERIPRIYI